LLNWMHWQYRIYKAWCSVAVPWFDFLLFLSGFGEDFEHIINDTDPCICCRAAAELWNRQEVKLGQVITAPALYRSHVASQLLSDQNLFVSWVTWPIGRPSHSRELPPPPPSPPLSLSSYLTNNIPFNKSFWRFWLTVWGAWGAYVPFFAFPSSHCKFHFALMNRSSSKAFHLIIIQQATNKWSEIIINTFF
jgi:hypothetical protein